MANSNHPAAVGELRGPPTGADVLVVFCIRATRRGHDVQVAVPSRTTRVVALPDRRRRGQRLDYRASSEHARACIARDGRAGRFAVFDRFAARLSYVSGDFPTPRRTRVVPPWATPGRRCSTSRFHRSCSAPSSRICGMPLDQFGTRGGGKAFGNDQASARALAAEPTSMSTNRSSADRSYLGKMGIGSSVPGCELSGMEPQFRDLRRSPWPRISVKSWPFLRPVIAPRCGRQSPLQVAVARPWGALGRQPGDPQGRPAGGVHRSAQRPTVVVSTTATVLSTVAADSTTETYAALRLDIETGAGRRPVLHPYRQAHAGDAD
jgi:hypothetical protein